MVQRLKYWAVNLFPALSLIKVWSDLYQTDLSPSVLGARPELECRSSLLHTRKMILPWRAVVMMHCERFRCCGDKHWPKSSYGKRKLGLSVTKMSGFFIISLPDDVIQEDSLWCQLARDAKYAAVFHKAIKRMQIICPLTCKHCQV